MPGPRGRTLVRLYVVGHDHGRVCECVADHRPTPAELNLHHVHPLGWGGPDDRRDWRIGGNGAWTCPTIHVCTHELLRLYVVHAGPPPYAVLVEHRLLNRYCRALAAEGWRREVAQLQAAQVHTVVYTPTAGLVGPRTTRTRTVKPLLATGDEPVVLTVANLAA